MLILHVYSINLLVSENVGGDPSSISKINSYISWVILILLSHTHTHGTFEEESWES